MLLRIALLLREALLLGIALLLREALLLGITMLLRIALLLGEALLLRIALLCVYIGESACAHLLSLLGMLIERVEGIGLVVSLTVIEGVGRVNVETACEFCGSSQLFGSLIIAAEEVGNCRSRSQTCSGGCFIGRENYLTAAVVNACIDKESDSLVLGLKVAVIVKRDDYKLLGDNVFSCDSGHYRDPFGGDLIYRTLVDGYRGDT